MFKHLNNIYNSCLAWLNVLYKQILGLMLHYKKAYNILILSYINYMFLSNLIVVVLCSLVLNILSSNIAHCAEPSSGPITAAESLLPPPITLMDREYFYEETGPIPFYNENSWFGSPLRWFGSPLRWFDSPLRWFDSLFNIKKAEESPSLYPLPHPLYLNPHPLCPNPPPLYPEAQAAIQGTLFHYDKTTVPGVHLNNPNIVQSYTPTPVTQAVQNMLKHYHIPIRNATVDEIAPMTPTSAPSRSFTDLIRALRTTTTSQPSGSFADLAKTLEPSDIVKK